MREVRIVDVVGSPMCVAADDGQRLNRMIADSIQRREKVILSFADIERLTTAFLNAAVGQLYGEFDDDVIREHLGPPKDATQMQLSLLRKAVNGAKLYFQNQERFNKINDPN